MVKTAKLAQVAASFALIRYYVTDWPSYPWLIFYNFFSTVNVSCSTDSLFRVIPLSRPHCLFLNAQFCLASPFIPQASALYTAAISSTSIIHWKFEASTQRGIIKTQTQTQPQLNSTPTYHNLSWVGHEHYFANHPTTHTNSMSVIYLLLLTWF